MGVDKMSPLSSILFNKIQSNVDDNLQGGKIERMSGSAENPEQSPLASEALMCY